MEIEPGCQQPLELNLGSEPLVRQYDVAFSMALQHRWGHLRLHEQYLGRIFGQELGSYIVHHALVDADELAALPAV